MFCKSNQPNFKDPDTHTAEWSRPQSLSSHPDTSEDSAAWVRKCEKTDISQIWESTVPSDFLYSNKPICKYIYIYISSNICNYSTLKKTDDFETPFSGFHDWSSTMMCKSGTKIYTIKCNAEHNPCDGARLIRWPINSWKKLWHMDLSKDTAPSSVCLTQIGSFCSTDRFDVANVRTSSGCFSSPLG